MEFRCRLATSSGEIVEGVYIAESEAHLRHDFEHKGLCVLSLRPRGGLGLVGLGRVGLPVARRRRVGTREFVVFNQELATLLKAGMPLVQSLDILRDRMSNPVFRSVLDDVHERVRAGTALSEAFAAHGDLFPGVYTASLLAGEKSGNLEGVLRRYVSYVKIIGQVKRRTLSALIYPAVLALLSMVVVTIIVFRVIPEFALFYAGFGAELPLMTRVIVGGAMFIRDNALWIALALASVATAVALWLRQPGERRRFDSWLLRIPAVGNTVRKFLTSQLARTLATLLGGGIPLVNSIEVAARSIANRHMAQEFEVVGQRVREGEAFAAALQARGIFPAVAVKMAEVGESTGALQDMLNSLADFYDEEIETDLGRFVTLVEPAMLVIIGLIIAALLLSLYMPLFQLSSVVGGR
jgi:type IV pilus assembly protein PilC